jgi:hypothetical protein
VTGEVLWNNWDAHPSLHHRPASPGWTHLAIVYHNLSNHFLNQFVSTEDKYPGKSQNDHLLAGMLGGKNVGTPSHRVKAYSDDFTDKEAVAAILRITRGNIRLIERLMMQVEHVLVANQLQVVTQEVVETARQNLIIGPD